jgi:ferritin-like metal-binding protein YciE
MDKIDSLKDMFLQLTRSIHDAEKVLNRTLPKMKAKAVAKDLKAFIDEGAEQKRDQQARLEGMFALLKESPEGVPDNIVQYLSDAKKELVEKCGNSELSDIMMIVLNRAITIHLINTYQTAISCARNLRNSEITRILKRSLLAEKGIEKKLRILEESHILVAGTAEVF